MSIDNLQDVSPFPYTYKSKEEVIQPDPINTFDLNNTATNINKSTSDGLDDATSTINSNTTSQTSTVNSNVNTLKETPAGSTVTITSGTSFQTVYSRSGQGTVDFISTAFGGGQTTDNYVFGVRLTIDGTIYATTTNASASGGTIAQPLLYMSQVLITDYPYMFMIGSSQAIITLKIPYKTSVKIEAYCNGVEYRKINYNVSTKT